MLKVGYIAHAKLHGECRRHADGQNALGIEVLYFSNCGVEGFKRRGNLVMKGYLKNPATTQASFAGDWFHSGDLAVWHEDGYTQIKDRSKDIIISGGENISSLELESVLFKHPKILEAAVVAAPDEKWGEVPCAFVSLKNGQEMTKDELIGYCREELAGFKIPKKVVFGPIDKTSTGKVQKYLLREKAAAAE